MKEKHSGNLSERVYNVVALHMTEWNPMNLREWCLPDEYSIEIEHIVKVLPHIRSSAELGEQLYWVMKKYFGPYADCTIADCVSVAERMYIDLQAVPESALPVATFRYYDNRVVHAIYEDGWYRRSKKSDK